jgi:hypothetical protein
MMTASLKIIVFSAIAITSFISVKGQEDNTILWKGRIINGDTGEPIPNAVIAVYSKTALYSSDIDGLVNLRLHENDSVRVVVLGYSAETYRIKSLQPETDGYVNLRVYPVTYYLKEVIVRGYKGLLDPAFFPKLQDDEPAINMHLPGDIGSKMSDIPPYERLLMEKPTINDIIWHPVSFVFTRFSGDQKTIKQLHNAKSQAQNEERLNEFINPEAIALITGYEGEELEKFIIYCNANLKLHPKDTGASITAQIEAIFEKYKKEF